MSLIRTFATATTLAALCLATSAASADNPKMKLGESTSVTAVSGYAGAYEELGGGNRFHAAHSLVWWESGDDPCKLQLYDTQINNFGIRRPTFAKCSNGGNSKVVTGVGNAHYIYKVQVCTTDKKQTMKNKLKGVRIWTRSINYENPVTLTTNATPQEAKHTHCKSWKPAVACGTGKIASAVRVHYNLYDDITGLALVCRDVENKASPRPPLDVTPQR